MGYISLPSNLNGIIGITSYYCVILEIMILHDAIKTIKNKVFPFSLKKEQNCFFKKNNKKTLKKTGGLGFLKKPRFFSTLVKIQPFSQEERFEFLKQLQEQDYR